MNETLYNVSTSLPADFRNDNLSVAMISAHVLCMSKLCSNGNQDTTSLSFSLLFLYFSVVSFSLSQISLSTPQLQTHTHTLG